MKKLKFLPSVLMLAMCIAVLCVGIYAASPTSNTVKGSITVTSMARIKITGYVNDEELFATRNTAAGIEWDLTKSDALKFDALNATTADEVPQKVIRIHIQNLNKDMALGAYFFNGDENTLETIDEDTKLATYASLVHEQGIWDVEMAESERTDENMLASSTLSTYTYIAEANSDNDYDEVDMYITINVENLSFEDVVGEFIYNLRVEEYRSNVTTETETESQGDTIAIMTQSEGEEATKTLMKLPEASLDNALDVTIVDYTFDDDLYEWNETETTNKYYFVPSISDANCGGIVIPTSYTGVDANTFNGCNSLEHINLPNSISYVNRGVVANCPNIKTFSTPVSAPSYTFYYDEDNYYYTVHYFASYFTTTTPQDISSYYEEKVIVGYDASGEDFEVLETRYVPTGLNFVYINDTFMSAPCKNIENYIFGQNTVTIGGFSGTNVKRVYIPRTTTTINNSAFSNCRSLVDVNIADGITTIGQYAFNGCILLKELYISKSVTELASNAFNGCNFSSINVDINNDTFHSTNNCLIETKSKKLRLGTSKSIIPSDGTVTSIGSYAFYGISELENIDIPDGIISIGSSAFYGCSKLAKIIIPDSVTSIGSNAFSRSGVTDVSIGAGLVELGNIFADCFELESVTIPSNITWIKDHAFGGCANLRNVILSEGLLGIGSRAFGGCVALEKLEVPTSLKSVHIYAFADCTNFNFNVYSNAKYLGNTANPYQILMFKTSTDITECRIHEDTKIIMNEAFSGCKSLTSLYIPMGANVVLTWSVTNASIVFGCSTVHIYCAVDEAPSSWGTVWNWGAQNTTYYGYTYEQYLAAIGA